MRSSFGVPVLAYSRFAESHRSTLGLPKSSQWGRCFPLTSGLTAKMRIPRAEVEREPTIEVGVLASCDSNVVLYLISGDPSKVARSAAVLGVPGILSVQVFNEVTSVLRSSKGPSGITPWSTIDGILKRLAHNHTVVPIDLATHERARRYAERYQLRIYDANIVAAAVLAGCQVLWTEDVHDGLVIDGLTIRNPYR
jgi:predicted nucleic acid-binding protein